MRCSRKEDDCTFDDGSQLSFMKALIERTRELEKLLHQAKQRNPDILDDQLGPGVLNELDQLRFASDPVPLTSIREDAKAVASSNEAGPSSDPILKPDSSELLPVTLVHKNPNLGDSLDVIPNLGSTTETEEEKLFRLSVLSLNSLPLPAQYSEKSNSLPADGPTTRIQPVRKETRCYRQG
jgi:hypothetical protein